MFCLTGPYSPYTKPAPMQPPGRRTQQYCSFNSPPFRRDADMKRHAPCVYNLKTKSKLPIPPFTPLESLGSPLLMTTSLIFAHLKKRYNSPPLSTRVSHAGRFILTRGRARAIYRHRHHPVHRSGEMAQSTDFQEETYLARLRRLIEQSYAGNPTGCGGSFGEILCWEIHVNNMTFVWLAKKWGINLSTLGELIWDHCKRLQEDPHIDHNVVKLLPRSSPRPEAS